MSRIPSVLEGLCDDAAIFPPGSLPLPEAVPAHLRHLSSDYADLVGPLVLSASAVGELTPLVGHLAPGAVSATVTVPAPDAIPAVLATLAALPAVRLAALEVALPQGLPADEVVPALDAALASLPARESGEGPGEGAEPTVFVEVPRDDRRHALLTALADSPYRAKFRTGGVRAELYPDEAELAAAIGASVAARLPFKATAGLHHAVRNTDPDTGFEQHGFLNVMLATDAALQGAPVEELERILADREGTSLAARVRDLPGERAAALRAAFTSFGTCSVTDPLDELTALHLVTPRADRQGDPTPKDDRA